MPIDLGSADFVHGTTKPMPNSDCSSGHRSRWLVVDILKGLAVKAELLGFAGSVRPSRVI